MRGLTQAEWQKLVQAVNVGDRITYWRTLSGAGNRYANLALQVATDSTVAGRGANRWFVFRAKQEGRTFNRQSLNAVGIDLMRADFQRRVAIVGGQYQLGNGDNSKWGQSPFQVRFTQVFEVTPCVLLRRYANLIGKW